MKIDEQIGEGVDARFVVSFQERKMADILAIDDNDRSDERDFAAVARLSELGAEIYELAFRPFVQAVITPQVAKAIRDIHPARVHRLMFSDRNPMVRLLSDTANRIMKERKPVERANPFLDIERLWASSLLQGFDFMRDVRDAIYELTFLSIYGSPFMHWLGASHAFERTRKDPKELRFLPEVQAILLGIDRGGFEEAVIRMLILLAESRGSVRRDRLERSTKVLTRTSPSYPSEPSGALPSSANSRSSLNSKKTGAIETLPDLLPRPEERRKAIEVVEFVVGPMEDMEPHTLQTLQRFHAVLGLPAIASNLASDDPLSENPDGREAA